jgi:DNA-binding response OmpR family regulator
MNKLLVVEDETITSDLLRRYFEIVGYEVISALNGTEAIKMAIEHKPSVVILDIMLPDIDGYEVCKRLRADERTNRIPIIFLTQKDERRNKLDGLTLGADDYITKPFDVEELRLRIHRIIDRLGGTPLVDPRTSLPNMALIKERLPKLLDDPESLFLDIEIERLDEFSKQYGPVAANQVVRSAAKIIGDLLHEIDPARSFIGHPRNNHFLLAIPRHAIKRVEKELPSRFAKQVVKFYDYSDQTRGKMKMGDTLVPFMAFKIFHISADALRTLTTSEERKAAPEEVGKKPASQETASPKPVLLLPPPSSSSSPPSASPQKGQSASASGKPDQPKT